MKAMESVHDLIQEAKLRTLWWTLCIFAVTYFLTHTSKSMWMNLPMSILFVSALRILINNVEFRWKVQKPRSQTYLSHLEKKQLSLNDPRLSSSPPPVKWKRKIDSPDVEAAMGDLIDKILNDFVVDLWYSEITPDREFPEQIRAIIMDVLAEISGRVKELNLVDLLTRDLVDLIGDHLDLFRRNQAAIGVDVMKTLSSEERDDRLKFHLLNSKELHPALISPESEYKVWVECPDVLQRLMSAVLATVLRQREAQCPVIRSIARELLTCVDLPAKSSATDSSLPYRKLSQETSVSKRGKYEVAEGKSSLPPIHTLGSDPLQNVGSTNNSESSQDPDKEFSFEGELGVDKVKGVGGLASDGYKSPLKRSNSASALGIQPSKERDSIISEFYSPEFERHSEGFRGKSSSDMIVRKEGQLVPKLRCRVMGAYFEKLGSTCFAVYSIAVTDAQNRTWFVKRRYRNFERLHRNLKDIPNYTLHLPPKRIFSSSTDDAFVHQRCIQLDKYLQDLLSIANVAEQHEVWDFFSISSKNYSFGKPSSVMKTLAVNVDDAVDDIVRQFKGVSDGLMRKVVGSPSLANEGTSTSTTWNLNWNADEMDKSILRQSTTESVLSSDYEEGEKNSNLGHENIDREITQDSGWHSDNALISKGNPSPVINRAEESSNLDLNRKHDVVVEGRVGNDVPATNFVLIHDHLEDPVVPPEWWQLRLLDSYGGGGGVKQSNGRNGWYRLVTVAVKGWTPPNVSVPVLNLVDKIFQLKKRGWIRLIPRLALHLTTNDFRTSGSLIWYETFIVKRQVFWISKQILQLVMEDAIDDWLLRQIHWLRREDTIAQGIRWVQDVLWPSGTFFLRIGTQIINSGSDQNPSQTISGSVGSNTTKSEAGSFEQQLEAARRASDIKKLLFG
ncbi:Sorting nexin, C-terminal [Sesbania bispinosa]|nr:Sorting nexin, C-terminal [Sesbania bispinosa]